MENTNEIILSWVDTQENRMLQLTKDWSTINSFSENPPGLATLLAKLSQDFASLQGNINIIDLPNHCAKALHITKRPEAPCKILFGGHMDTVYPPLLDHPIFDKQEKLHGPGTADMKGGLAIMLVALEALEKSPNAHNIGWEILITPDEEIGSKASKELWLTAGKRNHAGLIFEPAFPDGALVNERKGSANWTVVAKGVAAHAGRDFHLGKNAIIALSKYILDVHHLNQGTDAVINVGYISGGGPVNIIPDHCMCRINARMKTEATFTYLSQVLNDLASAASINGIKISIQIDNYRPPKKLTQHTQVMIDLLSTCGDEEGTPLTFRATGGVCDGNTLAEVGLPVLDTLGVVGGELHTPKEYAEISSFRLRCRLVTRFLLQISKEHKQFLKRVHR